MSDLVYVVSHIYDRSDHQDREVRWVAVDRETAEGLIRNHKRNWPDLGGEWEIKPFEITKPSILNML